MTTGTGGPTVPKTHNPALSEGEPKPKVGEGPSLYF